MADKKSNVTVEDETKNKDKGGVKKKSDPKVTPTTPADSKAKLTVVDETKNKDKGGAKTRKSDPKVKPTTPADSKAKATVEDKTKGKKNDKQKRTDSKTPDADDKAKPGDGSIRKSFSVRRVAPLPPNPGAEPGEAIPAGAERLSISSQGPPITAQPRPSVTPSVTVVPVTAPKLKKRKKKPCILCRKKLRVIYILSLAYSITVGTRFFIRTSNEGLPITEDSNFAARRFIITSIIVAALSLGGFVILVAGVSSMFIGILYMFAATASLYYCSNAISTAAYSRQGDDFSDILIHSKAEFVRNQKIPDFIANLQRRRGCCGWGIVYTTAWAETLGNNDFPDSCCIKPTKDCGKGLISFLPGGTLYSFETKYFNGVILGKKNKPFLADCARKILGDRDYFFNKNQSYAGVPDNILRKLDEELLRMSVFNKTWTDPLCPIWEYNDGIDILVYKSRGLEEINRVNDIIFGKSCETNEIENQPKNFTKYTEEFLHLTQEQMLDVMIYGSGLSFFCIVMTILFWYYYSRIQAKELSELPPPRDFQELDIESAAFEGESKFQDLDEDKAAKLEAAEKERKEKLIKKHIEQLEATAALEAAAAELLPPDKKKKRKRGEDSKKKGGKRGKSSKSKDKQKGDKDTGDKKKRKGDKKDTGGDKDKKSDKDKDKKGDKDKKTDKDKDKKTDKDKDKKGDKGKDTGDKDKKGDKGKDTGDKDKKGDKGKDTGDKDKKGDKDTGEKGKSAKPKDSKQPTPAPSKTKDSKK